jgi:hypothetical protein
MVAKVSCPAERGPGEKAMDPANTMIGPGIHLVQQIVPILGPKGKIQEWQAGPPLRQPPEVDDAAVLPPK